MRTTMPDFYMRHFLNSIVDREARESPDSRAETHAGATALRSLPWEGCLTRVPEP
jgi:hypothetical protein